MVARAEGHGHLRASHADREQAIGTLKAAFVHGMLTKDEFDQRVGSAFAVRTHADLAAFTADLPAGLTDSQPPTSAQATDEARIPQAGKVCAAATALYVVVWPFMFLVPWHTNSKDDPPAVINVLFFSATFIYLFVLVVAVGFAIAGAWRSVPADSWRGGQRPAQVVGHPRACHQSQPDAAGPDRRDHARM